MSDVPQETKPAEEADRRSLPLRPLTRSPEDTGGHAGRFFLQGPLQPTASTRPEAAAR